MKIVCTVINDLSQDQRMKRICTTLSGAGHEVILVGRQRFASLPLRPRPYQQHRIDVFNEKGPAFYLEYNAKLWRTIRKWDYDAIYAVDMDTLTAGAALTRGEDKKLILDAHEWFSETPEVVGRPLIRAMWRQVGKRLAPLADLRLTVAPMLAGKLAEDYGCDFHSIRNLPRHRKGKTSPRPVIDNKKHILYQGMLNPGRGLETAIRAMAQLPDHRLDVVGSGPLLSDLMALSKGLGVTDRIVFHGFVEPDRLTEYTDRAWLGLNLLEASSPSYYYSLANKSLDYIQAGLPSVQMDFPEYRAIQEAHECYLMLEGLKVKELVALIRGITPERYEALVSANERAAEVLNWEVEERKFLELISGIWARTQGQGK